MKKKSALILLFSLLLLGGGAYIWFAVYNKPKPNIRSLPTDFRIEAAALAQEFEASDSAALLKYQDKIIEISGMAREISITDSLPFVLIEGSELYSISCEFLPDATSKLKEIPAGTIITVKGQLRGSSYDPALAEFGLQSDIKLMKCSLVSER